MQEWFKHVCINIHEVITLRVCTYTYVFCIPGALVHTLCPKEKLAYIFEDLYQWPHDPNLTLTIIILLLADMGELPPTLYLRLDNCARENKNRYMLGFCSLLVDIGVFKKVSDMRCMR